jgi:hypothetical protein
MSQTAQVKTDLYRRVFAPIAATIKILILFLLVGASSARADLFNITFLGDFTGSGTITTDGACTLCAPGSGLLSLDLVLNLPSTSLVFDLKDDQIDSVTYVPKFNDLEASAWQNSEYPDYNLFIDTLEGQPVAHLEAADTDYYGTADITAASVPEPGSAVLLLSAVVILGFHTRRKLFGWRPARRGRD